MKSNKTTLRLLYLCASVFFTMSCNAIQAKSNNGNYTKISTVTKSAEISRDTIYKTKNLMLVRISKHTFQHISYLNTNDFGRVDCNGMVVMNDNKAIIFDTPTDDESSEDLINYLTRKLKLKIIAVIPTHFHNDCIGGIQAFFNHHIKAYAGNRTIEILKTQGDKNTKFIKGFTDSLSFNLGDKIVIAKYFGEGHTKDNITGYFPADSILFGGCLIKELNATKGYLGDANTKAWPFTVAKLQKEYPQAKIVIPGHGESGGLDLLDYTETLFQ